MSSINDPSPGANTIDRVLANTTRDIVHKLQLGSPKSQQVQEALSHLNDMASIYKQEEQGLY